MRFSIALILVSSLVLLLGHSTSRAFPGTGRAYGGPPDTYTKILLHGDGADASTTFTDSSVAPHTVTATGNSQLDTAQFKFGNASIKFDGTSDYISSASSADWDVFGGNFTIDFYVRFASVANTPHLMIIGPSNGQRQYLYVSGANLKFGTTTASNWTDHIQQAGTLSINTWYHVALVKSGTTFTLYLDGVSLGTSTTTLYSTGNQPLHLGNHPYTAFTDDLNGWIDEFRISKGIARWTSNFTPPNAAY